MADMKADGVQFDDFCLASLLNAYGNATPKQSRRAEAALADFAVQVPQAATAVLSHSTLAALGRAVGRSAAESLVKKHGFAPTPAEGASRAPRDSARTR